GDPGMDRPHAHRVVRRLEVEHAEVADDTGNAVEARRLRAELGGTVVAHSGDHVDALDEDPRRVVRHPVARGVVDGVAGRTAEPEKLHLRTVPGADEGDVLVAVPVDLAGTHHHVTPAGPHHV